MKALKMFIALVCLCCFTMLQTQATPRITYTDAGTDKENTLTFTAEDLDELKDNGYGTAYYAYFWSFGDGGFSFEESPTYTFKTAAASKQVTLELTQIYSDDEIEELGKTITVNDGEDVPEDENPQVRMEHDDGSPALVVLQSNRDPVEGKPVTFMATYEENTAIGVYNGIEFTYDTGEYSFSEQGTFNGETVYSSTPGKLILYVSPSATQKHIHYTLITATGVKGATSVQARAVLIPTLDLVDSYGLTTKTVGKSYDPNQKIVDKERLCIGSSPKALTLRYHIDFENIGTAPANSIVIEDELSRYLDAASVFKGCTEGSPCTVRNAGKWASKGLKSAKVFVKKNKIVWIFKGNSLIRGTKEPGYGTDFSEEDTQGFVNFAIKTIAPSRLPDCALILNSAQIIFDRNEPMMTAPATTLIKKNCDVKNACMEDAKNRVALSISGTMGNTSFAKTNTVGFDVGKTVKLNASYKANIPPGAKIIGETYEWYPQSGLSNSTIANPQVSPKATTTYTVAAVIAIKLKNGRTSKLVKTQGIRLEKK